MTASPDWFERLEAIETWREQALEFLHATIFFDLQNLGGPPDETSPEAGAGWSFSAADFALVLDRCERAAVRILYVGHQGAGESEFRYRPRRGPEWDARTEYERLRAENLNGRYSAGFALPEDAPLIQLRPNN